MPNYDHAEYNPSLKHTLRTNLNWSVAGNSITITNAHIKATSMIFFHHTSDHAGRWWISAISNGSFTITSSDAETTDVTFKYLIF